MSDQVKTCPACGNEIKAVAVICRFCKFDLREPVVAPPPVKRSSLPIVLIVVGVCCAGGVVLVPIIAAIAIPGLLAAQRASGERNASASLRTIATAEHDFCANDRDGNEAADFWTRDVRGLYHIKSSGQEVRLIEISLAAADASPGAPPPVPKAGYLFAAMQTDENGERYDNGTCRHASKFAFCAYPAEYGKTGRITFILNEDIVVWKKDTGGRAVTDWPANPSAKGWSRLD